MKGADRDAAIGAIMRQLRATRGQTGIERSMATGSLLALRGPLREVDDKLCRLPLDLLRDLPVLVLVWDQRTRSRESRHDT